MPQDVQLSLRSCAFKNPDAFGENPDGFGENPDAFCENSDAFGENPGAFVIYLPRDRWLCLWEPCLACQGLLGGTLE